LSRAGVIPLIQGEADSSTLQRTREQVGAENFLRIEASMPANEIHRLLQEKGFVSSGRLKPAVPAMAASIPDRYKGFTVWFTGMSGAGKTTISSLLAERLRAVGAKVEILDGDLVRKHLSKELGFSKADRDENIRRIGFVCEMLTRNGVISIAAAISPYRSVREEVRKRISNFVEIYVDCPLDVLVERDVKGLYKKALAGEIPYFTGITDPYERPLAPEVAVNSSAETPEESLEKVWTKLKDLGLISF
jgi:adenylyl-sulfate kinase